MIKFFKNRCWLKGTYHVASENGTVIRYASEKRVYYYQWIVPIIIFKVLLFRVPSLIWNFVIYLNGFDLVHVTKTILSKIYLEEYSESSNWSKTQKTIEGICDHFRMSFLKQKTTFSKKLNLKPKFIKSKKEDQMSIVDKANLRKSFPNLKTRTTCPLFVPYLFIKLIYLAIIVCNFIFIKMAFNFNFNFFGAEMIMRLLQNKYEFFNEYFPKKAFCDIKIVTFQNENEASFLCSLPINLFNEWFYIGYWFWLVCLFLLTVCSIFYWLLFTIKPFRRNFVLKALQLSPSQNINTSYTAAYYFGEETNLDLANSFLIDKTGMSLMDNFELFFNDVCSVDVIFTIKLISLNSNNLAFRDILNNLWDHYLDLDDLKLRDVKQRPILPIKRPIIFPERVEEVNEPKETINSA